MTLRTFVQDCCFGPVPKLGYRMGPRVAWIFWSGFSTVGLGTLLRSWWGCELVSLAWQSNRIGPRACLAHCLGIQIRQACTLNILVRRGSGVVLQTQKAMSYALCASPTVCKALGWVMQPLMCFGKVLWSGRLKTVYTRKTVYELVFLPSAVGGGSPRPLKLFVVLI